MHRFDFWVMWVSFSFCGHDTDTYRTVSIGCGAFELCLPSLGFLFTKLVLRTQYLGQRCRMTTSWGEDRRTFATACGSATLWGSVGVSTLDIYCGCIGRIPRHITSHSRTGMIVAYNLFSGAVVTVGNESMVRGRSGFTIPYHISCLSCKIHWWFRFGLPTLTMSPFWVWAGHKRPLPIITAWQ